MSDGFLARTPPGDQIDRQDFGASVDGSQGSPAVTQIDHSDLASFHEAFHSEALTGKTLLVPLTPTASANLNPLTALSDYLRGQKADLSQRVDKMLATRDPADMIRATVQLNDLGFESDVTAKVIGKAFAGIDAATKLN